MFPEELKYSETHEWVRCEEDDIVVVGITFYAQDALQDVTYVELLEIGTSVERGEEFGEIHSVKAASDLYSPVSGEIIDINEELEDAPELVNESPYEEGWMIKIKMSDPNELNNLITSEEYQATLEEEEEEE